MNIIDGFICTACNERFASVGVNEKLFFMIMKNFNLLFIFVLFTGMAACDDITDDLFWEISFDSQSKVIEKEIDGIVFKFCLLNEQGQPATVLNEGENFSFYFSVTNHSKKDFYYNAYKLAYEKKFLRIYTSSDFDLGKSYEPLLQTDIGIAAYPFDDEDVYIIKVPWLHEKDAVLCAESFYYESIIQKPLVKGFYYVDFKYSFYFQGQQDNNTIRTDSINFKINFKIQ